MELIDHNEKKSLPFNYHSVVWFFLWFLSRTKEKLVFNAREVVNLFLGQCNFELSCQVDQPLILIQHFISLSLWVRLLLFDLRAVAEPPKWRAARTRRQTRVKNDYCVELQSKPTTSFSMMENRHSCIQNCKRCIYAWLFEMQRITRKRR